MKTLIPVNNEKKKLKVEKEKYGIINECASVETRNENMKSIIVKLNSRELFIFILSVFAHSTKAIYMAIL